MSGHFVKGPCPLWMTQAVAIGVVGGMKPNFIDEIPSICDTAFCQFATIVPSSANLYSSKLITNIDYSYFKAITNIAYYIRSQYFGLSQLTLDKSVFFNITSPKSAPCNSALYKSAPYKSASSKFAPCNSAN